MNWLTEAFSESSVAWLLISTALAIISGYLSSRLTYRFKRQEIIDTLRADLQKEKHKSNLEVEQLMKERIRQEIVRWANPILGAVRDLEKRLKNILHDGGYLALSEKYQEKVNPKWSITYDYFMNSTLYLFSQYFSWVRMLQEDLSFELFQSHLEKDQFFEAVEKVATSLASFPPNFKCTGKDTQVFRLQQRAIGELMIVREAQRKRCLSYPEFIEKLNSADFELHLKSLKALLQDLDRKFDCKWKRINATHKALGKLRDHCEELLDLKRKI